MRLRGAKGPVCLKVKETGPGLDGCLDELRDIPHHAGATGASLIDGAIAYVEARLTDVFPGGDHSIFVADVVTATICSDEPPLPFHRGKYPKLG